ncbi:hypothetical protein ACFL34_04240 [Candidatus Sumerlaeota bacterium]
MRIKFRIWPGRGTPIENVFRMEVLQAFKKIDPDYADWMVSINYEVEEKEVATRSDLKKKVKAQRQSHGSPKEP